MEENKTDTPAATEPVVVAEPQAAEAGNLEGSATHETLAECRRQLEYYFSDENLRFDKFFQEKIKADDGWLNISYVMTSKKIMNLKVTKAELLSSLEGSPLLTKQEGDNAWIQRTEPLPELKDRRSGGGRRENKRGPQDMHIAGCIFKISHIPSDIKWDQVKAALKEKTPNKKVRFLLSHVENGATYGLAHKFDGDKEFYQTLTFEVEGGETVKSSLVEDVEEAKKVIARLPAPIRRDREKEINRYKQSHKPKEVKIPVEVAGVKFENPAHLKRSVKEALEKIPAGSELKKGPQFNVVRELLNYHPNAEKKTTGLTGIKVDKHGKAKNDQDKCFFVVREDGTTEDFSFYKCYEALCTKLFLQEKAAAAAVPAASSEVAVADAPVTAAAETSTTPPAEVPITAAAETPAA